MWATETPLRATISSSTRSWQSSAGLPEDARRDRGTGVGQMNDGDVDSDTEEKLRLPAVRRSQLVTRSQMVG